MPLNILGYKIYTQNEAIAEAVARDKLVYDKAICEEKMLQAMNELNHYQTLAANQSAKAEDLKKIIATKDEYLAELQKRVPSIDAIEKEITSKYPKQQMWYWGRYVPKADGTHEQLPIDVRSFLATYIDDQLPIIGGSTNDEKALRCLQWVVNNLRYVSDKSNEGFDEFWQFPYESIKIKNSDCDDFAILTAALCLKAGIPYYRVRVACGNVKNPNGEGNVGHAYLTYCRETDNKFVTMDGTYWPDTITKVANRPLHKDQRDYYGVWFSFDLKHVYAQKDYQTDAQRGSFEDLKPDSA